MIELDLFYNVACSAIREEQADYLKRQKAVPFPQELPKVEEISAEEYAKLRFFQRWIYRRMLRKQLKRYKKALRAQKMPVDELLTRGYNAGMETALRVISREFRAFSKDLEKEDKGI